MWGSHLIKRYSATQPTIAVSSGEAELTGLVKGATHSLGFQALAADMGIDVKIDLYSDASAAIGIIRRRGLGRIRHLDVTDLWLQERIRMKGFRVSKIAGADNLADILTKNTDRATLVKHLNGMNVLPEHGRPDAAPKLTHQT